MALPRLRVNPFFRKAVLASEHPLWQLASASGFTHYPTFSLLLHSVAIPDTATNVARFRYLADLVGFDREQVFLDPPAEVQP